MGLNGRLRGLLLLLLQTVPAGSNAGLDGFCVLRVVIALGVQNPLLVAAVMLFDRTPRPLAVALATEAVSHIALSLVAFAAHAAVKEPDEPGRARISTADYRERFFITFHRFS
ncbi:hypothetical protein WJ68_16235 [Burkholderia ubonensis]|uniref:MFS transporter n=1 Tax=Burkholderia ubonensis TaxID=101571 RepID=A0ABD4DZC4_9BURK|nr:hypothetical protein WJ68_16235 [Burkholderia ubonensis]